MAFRGEAVAVDLPNGQTLFALLRTEGANPDVDLAKASMAALDQSFRNDWVESAARIERLGGSRAPAHVRPEDYPMLVTFADQTDPTSVAPVDPDDLAATFGEGVTLRRITVQLTDEDVTVGIEERLNQRFWQDWRDRDKLESNRAGGLMRNPYFQSLNARIGRRDFSTEISE